MATVAAWEFFEIADEVWPVDRAGNVGDLATPAGLTTPAIVQGRWGRAREFGASKAFLAADVVTDATILARDVTLFGWIDFAIGNFINGQVGKVVQRQDGAGAVMFGFEVERVSATSIKVRAFWDGPTAASTAGITLTIPTTDGFMIGAVRTWNATADVDVRYFVNGDLVGAENVTEGDILPTSGGDMALGYDQIAVGDYLPDDSVIEFLQLEDDAITDEEMRQLYRRVAVHQPNGYKILRAFLPPPAPGGGTGWSRDPDSFVQRWIAAEGDGLGAEIADIERFREDYLPDRAYGGALEDWERITGQAPLPTDTVQARRDRVLTFLRVVLGFNVPDIKTALEPAFGLTSAQIEIIEGKNRHDSTLAATPAFMRHRPGVHSGASYGSGRLNIAADAGEVAHWLTDTAPMLRQPIGGGRRDFRLSGDYVAADHHFDVEVRIFSRTLPNDGEATGLIFYPGKIVNPVLGPQAVFFGLRNVAGSIDLAVYTYTGISGWQQAGATLSVAPAVPLYIRARNDGGGLFSFFWDSVGPGITANETQLAVSGTPAEYVSIINQRFDDQALASNIFGEYDGWRSKFFDDPATLHWIAYRDPGLGGTYDLQAGDAAIDRLEPSHTNGGAVSDKDMLAGDPESVVGSALLKGSII